MRLRASATSVSNAGPRAGRARPRRVHRRHENPTRPCLPTRSCVDHDLVTAFEVGWSVLYQDVSLFVAEQLASTLADLQCDDADTRRGLLALRRTLKKQRQAGTPWLARDAADVLAMLDMTVWVSVLGLLDECPILTAALTAVLERRTTSRQPDRVRVHLDDRSDRRHSPLHEDAPRRLVRLWEAGASSFDDRLEASVRPCASGRRACPSWRRPSPPSPSSLWR